jgi:hypothetical protein
MIVDYLFKNGMYNWFCSWFGMLYLMTKLNSFAVQITNNDAEFASCFPQARQTSLNLPGILFSWLKGSLLLTNYRSH